MFAEKATYNKVHQDVCINIITAIILSLIQNPSKSKVNDFINLDV